MAQILGSFCSHHSISKPILHKSLHIIRLGGRLWWRWISSLRTLPSYDHLKWPHTFWASHRRLWNPECLSRNCLGTCAKQGTCLNFPCWRWSVTSQPTPKHLTISLSPCGLCTPGIPAAKQHGEKPLLPNLGLQDNDDKKKKVLSNFSTRHGNSWVEGVILLRTSQCGNVVILCSKLDHNSM